MRELFFFFFALVLLMPFGVSASPLTITWSLEGNTEPLQAHEVAKSPQTWQLVGLPFPGTVLWRPKTQELAYQHPEDLSWLHLTPTDLPKTPPPTLTPAAAGQPWQGAPTRRWAMQTGKKSCGALFVAKSLGNGLSVADIQSIHALLSWLNLGETPQGCTASFPDAPGLGLPTLWAGPMGQLALSNIGPLDTTLQAALWPTITYPATPEVRLRLLLSQLPIPERAHFLQTHSQYPLLDQIENLAKQLKTTYANPPL